MNSFSIQIAFHFRSTGFSAMRSVNGSGINFATAALIHALFQKHRFLSGGAACKSNYQISTRTCTAAFPNHDCASVKFPRLRFRSILKCSFDSSFKKFNPPVAFDCPAFAFGFRQLEFDEHKSATQLRR